MSQQPQINKITVIGAGTMGPGIAQIFAIAGCRICMYDTVPEALEKAKQSIHDSLETFAQEGLVAKEDVEPLFARVSYDPVLESAVSGSDLIVEAIVEKPDVKTKLYETLDRILPENVIIASNTSALNIFELMPPARLPSTIIAHWYAPPQLIPLVEVVANEQTREGITDAVMDVLRKGGKCPVLMKKFIRGYIVNRIQMCLNQEIFFLLDNGYCTPQDIDLAVKTSFIPRAMVLGVCQRIDFGGLQMTANNFKNRSYTMPPATDMPRTLGEHIEKGELGVVSGKGLYDYTGKDKKELLAKRDHQLFEAFRLSSKLLDDPL